MLIFLPTGFVDPGFQTLVANDAFNDFDIYHMLTESLDDSQPKTCLM